MLHKLLHKSLLKKILNALIFYSILSNSINLIYAVETPNPINPTLTPAGKMPVICGVYQSDPAHTSLFFKVNHFGLSNYTAAY
jgi:polyisoprenoid-binding protein YceI